MSNSHGIIRRVREGSFLGSKKRTIRAKKTCSENVNTLKETEEEEAVVVLPLAEMSLFDADLDKLVEEGTVRRVVVAVDDEGIDSELDLDEKSCGAGC